MGWWWWGAITEPRRASPRQTPRPTPACQPEQPAPPHHHHQPTHPPTPVQPGRLCEARLRHQLRGDAASAGAACAGGGEGWSAREWQAGGLAVASAPHASPRVCRSTPTAACAASTSATACMRVRARGAQTGRALRTLPALVRRPAPRCCAPPGCSPAPRPSPPQRRSFRPSSSSSCPSPPSSSSSSRQRTRARRCPRCRHRCRHDTAAQGPGAGRLGEAEAAARAVVGQAEGRQ